MSKIAKFPCPECGGTGMKEVSPGHHMDASFSCTYCQDGVVEMTLVAVVNQECPEFRSEKDCSGICPAYAMSGCVDDIIIPITPANIAEHPDTSTYEWRKV